jgi:hypothetical protein
MLSLLASLAFYYNAILLGDTSQITIRDYMVNEALVAGVDPQLAIGVAKAESGFNCEANGDNNHSHGCWQIFLPAHLDVTHEQAHDIIWSTNWALKEMKVNGCKIWSVCDGVMEKLKNQSGG